MGMAIKIKPLGSALGAEVSGVGLAQPLDDLIVPFKRRLYEDLVAEFGPIVRAFKDGTAPPA